MDPTNSNNANRSAGAEVDYESQVAQQTEQAQLEPGPPNANNLNVLRQIQIYQGDVFYNIGSETEYEDLLLYQAYGLHPVIPGDVLPKPGTCISDRDMEPRYRVVVKLNFSAFSITWLCCDLFQQ